MGEWMGDTPQTAMTTRAPAVLKTNIKERFSLKKVEKQSYSSKGGRSAGLKAAPRWRYLKEERQQSCSKSQFYFDILDVHFLCNFIPFCSSRVFLMHLFVQCICSYPRFNKAMLSPLSSSAWSIREAQLLQHDYLSNCVFRNILFVFSPRSKIRDLFETPQPDS